jgi:hypothetical protein
MFSKQNQNEINKFIPGFTMGIVRSTISHPFEMLKLKSQMGINENIFKNLYKGLHLSIISNSIERGIQFYYFDKFKKNNNIFISSLYSSLISTSISLPYNIILLKKNILKDTIDIHRSILFKSGMLEYKRNILGSTIFLYSYDTFKNNNIPFQIAGVLSSIIVWGITYPIDNIKNQIIAKQKFYYNLPFLYKGIQYPIIRSVPSAVIGLYVYEYLNNYLNK